MPLDGDNPTRVVSIRKLRWTDRRGAFRSSCGAVRVVRRDDPWVPSAPVLEGGGGMQFIEDGFVLSRSFALSSQLCCVDEVPTWSRWEVQAFANLCAKPARRRSGVVQGWKLPRMQRLRDQRSACMDELQMLGRKYVWMWVCVVYLLLRNTCSNFTVLIIYTFVCINVH